MFNDLIHSFRGRRFDQGKVSESSLSFIFSAALAMFSSSSLVNLGFSLLSDLRKVTSFPSAVVTVSYLSGFLFLSRVSQELSNEDIFSDSLLLSCSQLNAECLPMYSALI